MRLNKLLINQKAIFNFVKMRSALFCDLPKSSSPESTDNKSHTQGSPSGKVDEEGHHLRKDATPDLRFKENQEEDRNEKEVHGHHVKSDGSYDKRYKENNPYAGNPGTSEDDRGKFSGEYDKSGHHLKSDGTHDNRFKENREHDNTSDQPSNRK